MAVSAINDLAARVGQSHAQRVDKAILMAILKGHSFKNLRVVHFNPGWPQITTIVMDGAQTLEQVITRVEMNGAAY